MSQGQRRQLVKEEDEEEEALSLIQWCLLQSKVVTVVPGVVYYYSY